MLGLINRRVESTTGNAKRKAEVSDERLLRESLCFLGGAENTELHKETKTGDHC